MTRNVEMLVRAARALGDLRDEVVFVGGAVVDLFITDPAAPRPRFTEDVDVVVEVTTHSAWSGLGERLRALGFREDQREGAPLCRWLIGDLAVDVMPVIEQVLGFSNRWYRMARAQSEERELPGGVRIRVALAPLFLATKMEAFRSRGRGDFVASHDIEDIIAVVDGRPSVADEAKLAPAQLRHDHAMAEGHTLPRRRARPSPRRRRQSGPCSCRAREAAIDRVMTAARIRETLDRSARRS